MHYHHHSYDSKTSVLDEKEGLGKVYSPQVTIRLLSYLKPYKLQVATAVVTMIVFTLTSVAVPWLVSQAIGYITRGDLNRLYWLMLLFVANALLGWVTNYIQLRAMAHLGQKVLLTLRTQLFDHLQCLSLSFHDRNEVGRIMSRVQNDVIQLQEFLTSGILILGDLLTLGGIIVVLFLMDIPLALITLAVLPLLFLIMGYWQRFAWRAFMRVRRTIAAVNAGLEENISGVRVIQSLVREDVNFQHFNKTNQDHLKANLQANRLSSAVVPTVEFLSWVATALVIVFGGAQVLDGDLEIGVLVAFALYIQRFFDPIRNLTMQYAELQRAMASGTRIFEVLDTQPDIQDAPDAIELPPIKGDIRFHNVSFSYVKGIEVLKDINLCISPGETVALVGPTGAGKSTIISLILRLYDVSQGKITIDGIDIRRVKRRSLGRQVAVVLQDPFLFSGTIKDNIRYGRLEATDEEIREAAKAVGAHDFIQRLEKGYETRLQERGGNLSVGQRQLISFARALVVNPPVLILDEATANIDTQAEVMIQQALKRLLQGRTSIVIAHRLSTVRDAHRIVVVEGARIVEEGTPQELLERRGLYARLYTMSYRTE